MNEYLPFLKKISPALQLAITQYSQKPTTCILSSKIAKRILMEILGLPARLQAYYVDVCNLEFAKSYALLEQGEIDQVEMDSRGGYALAIRPHPEIPYIFDGFSYHVVTLVESDTECLFWDLSIGQVNRPQYGIVISPLVFMAPRGDPECLYTVLNERYNLIRYEEVSPWNPAEIETAGYWHNHLDFEEQCLEIVRYAWSKQNAHLLQS